MKKYAITILPKPARGLSWLLGAATLSIGLVAIQNGASAQPVAARAPIVSLEYDNASRTLWKATSKTLASSSDEGRTWTPSVVPAFAKGDISAVTVSVRDPNAIYIGGQKMGVLRSQDRGRKWAAGNKGLPSRKVVALSVHSDQARTVYAYIDGKGIFRSQDAGANWRLMDSGPRDAIVDFVHSNMPGSMETGWLFAAKKTGVGRSMDCFCGWHAAGKVTGTFHAVSYDPDRPEQVYAAAREGFFVSSDGGEQWNRMKTPTGTITALTATPGGGLYAAIDGKLIRSRDRGVTWENVGE